jgi:hypothetical protein
MEVVGSIATVISLAQGVCEGVKIAKTLYQAPKELAALQVGCGDIAKPYRTKYVFHRINLRVLQTWYERSTIYARKNLLGLLQRRFQRHNLQ